MTKLITPRGKLIPKLILGVTFLAFTLVFCPVTGAPCNAQTNPEKALNADFYPEAGCPVSLTNVRTVLEIDPFGAPTASKIYLTYTNNSSKPLEAVKFRCRFSDAAGKDCGTFHAPDAYPVPAGGSRSHKWKREGGLHPKIDGFQLRVLQVKFSDGSIWESAKMHELTNLQQEEGGGSFGAPGEVIQNPPPAQALPGEAPYLQPPQSSFDTQQQPAQQSGYQQSTQPGQYPDQNSGGYDKAKELPW